MPTTIFPGHPISLATLEDDGHRRPLRGVICPRLVSEIASDHGGRVALVADGLDIGVIVDIGGHTWADPGMHLHVVGGERVRLLQTLERTPAGGRLAAFARVDDEPLTVDAQRALEDEAVVARTLLVAASVGEDGGGGGGGGLGTLGGGAEWELLLCHLDDELYEGEEEDGLARLNPTAHPQWLSAARLPDDPVELAFWLSCRLPMTTALRAHLLGLQSPLKRLRDVVDALRLLSDPSRVEGRRFAKFAIVWHTAEASGCELEPPRPVVHWRGDDVGFSRY
jgi:hypothetical protein